MKIMSLLIGVVVLSMVRPAAAQAVDPNFHVYLCVGQSNMEGASRIPDAENRDVDPRFRMLACVDFPRMNRQAGEWYDAVPPLVRSRNGLGPADYFGRTMVAALPKDVKVGVVAVAVGAARIELFQPEHYEEYLKTAPNFVKNWTNEYGGNPYAKLVEMAKIAQKTGVIKGILLHQGESNPNDHEWPAKVKSIYDHLIKDLNLNPKDVPLLAGETLSEEFKGKCWRFNQIMAELPKVLPNSHVVSSAGCAGQPDGLHFTVEGYKQLGTNYAKTMLAIEGIQWPPTTAPGR